MGTFQPVFGSERSRSMNSYIIPLIFLGIIFCGSAWAAQPTVVAFGDSTTARRKGTEVYVRVLQDRLGADAVMILNKGIPRHTMRWPPKIGPVVKL